MDRFSPIVPMIVSMFFCMRAPAVLASDAGRVMLLQHLASSQRYTDVFQLSLLEMQSETCRSSCKSLWARNAARSLLRIGDYNGAITYLHYGLQLNQEMDSIPNKELIAYAALQKRDSLLWQQYSVVFTETRRKLIEGLTGPEAFLPQTRQQLLTLASEAELRGEPQQQLLRYGKADQLSPWVTGTFSAVIPGGGLMFLGMNSAAAQSFFLTAASAWATSQLFQQNLQGPGFAAALITSVFYIGGIQATVRSTNEHNLGRGAEDREKLIKWTLPALEFEWQRSF